MCLLAVRILQVTWKHRHTLFGNHSWKYAKPCARVILAVSEMVIRVPARVRLPLRCPWQALLQHRKAPWCPCISRYFFVRWTAHWRRSMQPRLVCMCRFCPGRLWNCESLRRNRRDAGLGHRSFLVSAAIGDYRMTSQVNSGRIKTSSYVNYLFDHSRM